MAQPEAGIRLDRDGPVATVTLCRPIVRNAQTPAMWQALAECGRTLPGDVRVVVVRGEGSAFSAGIDLSIAGSSPGGGVFADIAALADDAAHDRIASFQG